MPEEKKWEDVKYYDHSKGLISDEDAMNIPDNAVTDCNNVIFKKRGSIKKRLGYTALGSQITASVSGVMGLHAYYGEGIKHLLAVVHTGLYRWNDPNWTNIVDTLTANKRTEFANAINKCIITNGEDISKKLTDTTLVNLGSGTAPDDWRPNKADFVRWFHNVLWFANLTEKDATKEGSRARHTEIRNIEGDDSWVWTYYMDSEADDGFNVSGLIPFRDNLLVMKPKRTAMIVGSSRDDWGIFNYDNAIGSPAHRSMQEYYGRLWHLGEKALFWFDGTYNIPYSDDIQDIIDSIDKANLYKGASCLWDDKYHITVPIGDGYTTIVYDFRNNSFTKYTGINASCFAYFKPANEEFLYFGESDAGKVYRLFTGYSDNNANISASFTTGKKFTGETNWVNDVRHLWVEAKGNAEDTLTIQYRFDENATWLPEAGWEFDLSNRFQRFVFPEGSFGRTIQFKVSNSSKLSPFEFFGIILSKSRRYPFR